MPNLRMLPPSGRPQLPKASFEALIRPLGINLQSYPLVVAGLRGYFTPELHPGAANVRGIYDDALFLYAPAANLYRGFNANTDPSVVRRGQGNAAAKGIAALQPGVWNVYRFAIHGGRASQYEAICQRAGMVEVLRDGSPPYRDRGNFGINIHRGGRISTSSEGCQTIVPEQWGEFIGTAQAAGKQLFGAQWRERTIAYALLDQATYGGAETRPKPAANSRKAQALEFLETVIRPTLAQLQLASRPAELLLLGTAIVESGLVKRTQDGGGPARGLFQMEMATHDDIWRNYLAYRPALAERVRGFKRNPQADAEKELVENDAYACAMARVHYFRVPARLPPGGEVNELAHYWKDHYNTLRGKGTVERYVHDWHAVMG